MRRCLLNREEPRIRCVAHPKISCAFLASPPRWRRRFKSHATRHCADEQRGDNCLIYAGARHRLLRHGLAHGRRGRPPRAYSHCHWRGRQQPQQRDQEDEEDCAAATAAAELLRRAAARTSPNGSPPISSHTSLSALRKRRAAQSTATRSRRLRPCASAAAAPRRCCAEAESPLPTPRAAAPLLARPTATTPTSTTPTRRRRVLRAVLAAQRWARIVRRQRLSDGPSKVA